MFKSRQVSSTICSLLANAAVLPPNSLKSGRLLCSLSPLTRVSHTLAFLRYRQHLHLISVMTGLIRTIHHTDFIMGKVSSYISEGINFSSSELPFQLILQSLCPRHPHCSSAEEQQGTAFPQVTGGSRVLLFLWQRKCPGWSLCSGG